MVHVGRVIEQLSDEVESLSPSMQRAAMTILDSPNDVAVDSMRSLAAKASVSPPTMLRLAQRLGFESYEKFRDVFRDSVTRGGYGERANDLREATHKGGIAGLIAETVNAAENGMDRFLKPAFVHEIERVADVVIDGRQSIVVASGASFGQAVTFRYVCRMALPTLDIAGGFGVRAVDEMASVGPQDAVLAVTTFPYAASTVEASRFAKDRGARIAAVTDSRTSPVGRFADAAAVIETQSPHYFPSMIALNAALEILSAVITVKRGADGVRSITDYETALRKNAYYLEDDV